MNLKRLQQRDECGPPSPAGTPIDSTGADAVRTYDREPEVAHPSTGGFARAKSTDDMDTLQFMIDTQAGIDCAMELPLTQPMWHDFLDDTPLLSTAPVLTRRTRTRTRIPSWPTQSLLSLILLSFKTSSVRTWMPCWLMQPCQRT